MKKVFYEKPYSKIDEFKTVEILTASGGGDGEETTSPADDNPTGWSFR